MKTILICSLSLFTGLTLSINCPAQRSSLSIGDKIPDIELQNIFNSNAATLKLSDYKGKLVILDFWSTECISCIEAFPQMDSLQRSFNDKLRILLVNPQSKDSTASFFKHHHKILKPAIPLITADTILSKLFPHIGVPFHVWIDSAGIVKYIPDSRYTTFKNIDQVIKGIDIALPRKENIVYVESFFDEKWKDLLQTYSYISKCDNHLHLEPSKQKGFELIAHQFYSAEQLYQAAFDGLTKNRYNFTRHPGITILEAKEPAKYMTPKKESSEWREQYAYNYHLSIPEEKKEEKYKIMKEDLDRYFEFSSKIEKRKIKCLVLVRTSKTDKLKTSGGNQRDTFDQSGLWSTKTDSITYMDNQPFALFSSRIGAYIEHFLSKTFIDATNYKGNIDVEIKDKIFDSMTIPGLRDELKKYNLDLIERYYWKDVLVLTEKDYKPPKNKY